MASRISPDTQKVVIPSNKLPYATSDGLYYIRFRVTTENGENVSAWSAKFAVPVLSISDLLGSETINYKMISDGNTITITWKPSSRLSLDTYDMYYKWSTTVQTDAQWAASPWTYLSTTQANSGSIQIPVVSSSAISSVAFTSTTATYTTATDHGLSDGDYVTISGIAPDGYNGIFPVTGKTTNTFTIANTTNTTVTDGVGTAAIKQIYVGFWIQAPTTLKQVSTSAKLFSTDTSYPHGVPINTIPAVDGGTPWSAV